MFKKKYAPKISLLLILIFCIVQNILNAKEQINNFHSTIYVHKDGTLIIKEDLEVNAEGQAIKRGIVREFPTDYHDRFGNRYIIDFEILNIKHNNKETRYIIKRKTNGLALYIGNPEKYLTYGTHRYSIEYKTKRQLGFFKNHDELYWNITGNGWRLPIKYAEAEIHLPKEIPQEKIKIEGYTGKQGSKQRDYSIDIVSAADNTPILYISSIYLLNPYEGLTVAVSWPKGYVQEPTIYTKIYYLFKDNIIALWLLLILLFLLFFYMRVWIKIRKIQKPGIIIPLFEPPEEISPGAIGYHTKRKYEHKQFAAELVLMAVNQVVEINKNQKKLYLNFVSNENKYQLVLKKSNLDQLPVSFVWKKLYKTILDILFKKQDKIDLNKKNNHEINKAVKLTQNNYSKQFQTHFDSHISTIFFGIIISAIGAIIFFISQFSSNQEYLATISIIILFCIIMITFIFSYKIFNSYNKEGRSFQDKIDGFKLFLETTELDRIAILGTPPTKTPELFERYLPYAIALGVEKAWTKQFASVFAQLEKEGHPYQPVWYHGGVFTVADLGTFSSVMASSLSSTISSSSIAPGTRSGSGGGGSSGGGSGGGGGGGW